MPFVRDLLGKAASLAEAVVDVAITNAPRKGDALLNGPDKVCECGDCECGSPLPRDPDARPGREFHD